MPTRGGTCTKPCFNQQPWEMPVSPLPLPGSLYSTQMQEHAFPLGHLVHLFHLLMGGCCSSTDCTADTGPRAGRASPHPRRALLRAASTLVIACDPESGVPGRAQGAWTRRWRVMSPAQHSCVVHVLGGRWELRDVTSLSTLSYHRSRSPVARIFL